MPNDSSELCTPCLLLLGKESFHLRERVSETQRLLNAKKLRFLFISLNWFGTCHTIGWLVGSYLRTHQQAA